MDNWDEIADKSWGVTHLHLTRKSNKEKRKLERKKSQEHFESSAVFHKAPHPHTLEIHQGGATNTKTYSSFTSAMEYAAALEEKANKHDERIIELEASVDGQTVLTGTTAYVAIAVATGTNKEMSKIKAMIKQLAASVTSQATKVETLSTKMNGGIRSSGKNIYKKKARPGLHMCAHCKREVYPKDGNCLELEANKTKRYPGQKSVFTKE